jgi:hypothetical protein
VLSVDRYHYGAQACSLLLVLPLLSQAGCPVDTDATVKTTEELELYLKTWESSASECRGNLSVTFQEPGKYSLAKGYTFGGSSLILDGSKQDKGSITIVGPPDGQNDFLLSSYMFTALNIAFVSGGGCASSSRPALPCLSRSRSLTRPLSLCLSSAPRLSRPHVSPKPRQPRLSKSLAVVPVAGFAESALMAVGDMVLKDCSVQDFETTNDQCRCLI